MNVGVRIVEASFLLFPSPQAEGWGQVTAELVA
jgi:hypothetical protein